MNRFLGNRYFIVVFFAVVMLLGAGGSGSFIGMAVGASAGDDGHEVTGELTGTLNGESFVRYSVGLSMDDMYINTATWSHMPFSLPGFPAYVVRVQGHKSVSGFDFNEAITLEFYLDDQFRLFESGFADESPISYFPDGLTFDMEKVYTMTEGTMDVTEVSKHGDILGVKGSFAGILMRWQWTDQATFEGEHEDPIKIEGQFHVHKVTYEE